MCGGGLSSQRSKSALALSLLRVVFRQAAKCPLHLGQSLNAFDGSLNDQRTITVVHYTPELNPLCLLFKTSFINLDPGHRTAATMKGNGGAPVRSAPLLFVTVLTSSTVPLLSKFV